MNKVAICFYGQPRRYKEILNDWKKIIEETDSDVFIHTWIGKDRIGNDINVNELIDDFKPKEIQVSNLHRFLSLIPKDFAYQNYSYHVMQRTYSSNMSFNILNEYSKNFNVEYGTIIETRLDVKVHDLIKFINFIKSIEQTDSNLYVCENHWRGHTEFDDAWMVGNFKYISPLWSNSFKDTINFINKTSVIPANEFNLTRYVIESELYQNVKRVSEMNYDLLPMQTDMNLVNVHQNI